MPNATPSLDTLFCEAISIADAATRGAYIREACGSNAALYRRVEALVVAHFRAGEFLERPVCEAVAEDQFPDSGVSATLNPPPLAERPGTTIGRYKLLQEIGDGGMGVVFMAEQREPVRRKVALKIIKPGMDTREVIARFDAERQALAMMDHPNVAHVLDAGSTDSGRPYFVMELVHGVPITEFSDGSGLTTRERLELFVTVCQAVQHAHQKGIIHRDIKPSNVMVTLRDGVPVPKIIDFGIAKATNQQLTDMTVFTRYGQMVGTPLYMSPEQAEMNCLDVDTRSDVYSLGVLLYELVTGATPFDKERLREAGLDEVRRLIREEEPLRPSALVGTLGGEALSTITQHRGVDVRRLGQLLRGDLDWIVMKALEKDRTRRYESASALAADVEHYLRDEPVVACPPSTAYRLRKYARRHKTALTTLVVVAATLVLGLVVSLWQAIQATQARQLADQRLENEKQARHEADAERMRAESNYRTAREAIQQMVTRVANEQLAFIPQMREVRRRVLEDAAQCYTKLIELNPRDALTHYERAGVYDSLAEYGKVRADYEKGIELQPDNAEFRQRLGHFLRTCPEIAYWDVAQAVVHFRRAVELEPKNPEYYAELGNALCMLGKRTDGVAALRKALEVAPGSPFGYLGAALACDQMGDPAKAVEYYEKTIQVSPESSFSHGRLAQLYWDSGQRDRAIAAATAAIEASKKKYGEWGDSEDFLWYMGRGDIYASLEQYGEALADYDKAVDSGRSHWVTFKRHASAQFHLKHYDQALASIAKAVELTPGDFSNLTWLGPTAVAKCPDERLRAGLLELADKTIRWAEDTTDASRPKSFHGFDTAAGAYVARAELHGAFGQPDKAEVDFAKAIELEPKNSDVWRSRAIFYVERANWDSALADLSKAVDLKPEQANVWYRRVLVRVAAGRLEDYRKDCVEMLQRFGQTDKPDDAHWVAWACALAPDADRDWAMTVALAEKAVTSDPTSIVYLNTLGAVQYRAGRFDEALARLAEADALVQQPSEALQSSPAYTWYFLAMAHHRLGHGKEANQRLDKAVAWTDKIFAEADQGTAGLSWNRRLTLKLFRDEATTLLKPAPAAVPEPPASQEEKQPQEKHEPKEEAKTARHGAHARAFDAVNRN